MAQRINEVMTADPRTCDEGDTVTEVARQMRDGDVGAILVTSNGAVAGIVTDRDIAVRAVAEGRDPDEVTAGEIATRDVATLAPDSSVEDAIRIVREHNVRRIPVLQDGRPAGIVTIGDLAIERDEDSVLADISAAEPDR